MILWDHDFSDRNIRARSPFACDFKLFFVETARKISSPRMSWLI